MDKINQLTAEQLSVLPQILDKESKPIRFLAEGCAVNICTGVACSKNSNIIYHPVYWCRPKEFIDSVLNFLRTNNPGISFKVTKH